jgi:glycosyltransferase involved in cell wall biosynthesis
MIRVLHVLPWGLVLGGVETTVMNYYRVIDRTRIQFDFFTPDDIESDKEQMYAREVKSLGARIFRHPTHRKHPIKSTVKLYRVLKEHPDLSIVHIYGSISLFPFLSAFAALLAGIRIRIIYSSITQPRHPLIHRLFRLPLRMVATHWTACSAEAGVHMFGKKAKERCSIAKRARDLEAFCYDEKCRNKVRSEMDLSGQVIIHVGRMVKRKNHSLLIEAFNHAQKDKQDMVLLLVGDGELKEQLIEKVNKLQLENRVIFLGQRDDVPDLLQAADLFVLPSSYEGLPGVSIEAQAAGLPCLLADTISPEAKVIDPVEFLPICDGPDIWAERMLAYIGYKRSDSSVELRRAGYDINQAVKSLEELYKEIPS